MKTIQNPSFWLGLILLGVTAALVVAGFFNPIHWLYATECFIMFLFSWADGNHEEDNVFKSLYQDWLHYQNHKSIRKPLNK